MAVNYEFCEKKLNGFIDTMLSVQDIIGIWEIIPVFTIFTLFFPAVIERQWAAISQFHDIIKNASDAQLSNSSASVEETMEAILSVILLKATSKGIFEEFLHQRQLELISKLKRHDVSAKNHITYSLSAISSVLCIVHQTFYQVNMFSLVYFSFTLEGHSQITLATFFPLLTTYLVPIP